MSRQLGCDMSDSEATRVRPVFAAADGSQRTQFEGSGEWFRPHKSAECF